MSYDDAEPDLDEILAMQAEMAEDAIGSACSNTEASTGPAIEFGDVLDMVRAHFAAYVMTCSPGDLDILALWTVHTHLCEETYTSPRISLDSPVPGSGKTTVLEHFERLAFNPVQMASVSSPALLVRLLANGVRTILIDEVDRSLNPKKPGIEDIIAVLNSGYKVGASRPVLVPDKEQGWVAKEMPTYSPVAMAGNSPHLPDDTRSRCLEVLLMPAQEGDVAETDWELIDADVRALGEAVAAGAELVREHVRTTRPSVPAGCTGRMKERWLPLKRVAAAASPEWAGRVDRLILQDLDKESAMREEGLTHRPVHITLLHHIHEVWLEGETFMPTSDLIPMLIARHPEMWGSTSTFGKDLTPQRLGRMLTSRYRIHSDRPGSVGPRGYQRADFEAAFRSMRITGSAGSTGSTGSNTAGFDPAGSRATASPVPLPIEPVEPVRPAEPAGPECPTCGNTSSPQTGKCYHCIYSDIGQQGEAS